MHVYVCDYEYGCVYICMYACMYVYVYMYVCVCLCLCECIPNDSNNNNKGYRLGNMIFLLLNENFLTFWILVIIVSGYVSLIKKCDYLAIPWLNLYLRK